MTALLFFARARGAPLFSALPTHERGSPRSRGPEVLKGKSLASGVDSD